MHDYWVVLDKTTGRVIAHCGEECDALIIGTEWQEFKKPNFGLLGKLKSKKIFDGRNCMEINGDTESKFKYYRISS